MRKLIFILLTCFVLLGCQGLQQRQEVLLPTESELIIVELPLEELRKTCGLWSGVSGCIWMNHKFILETSAFEGTEV
jgi:hypothetical protein